MDSSQPAEPHWRGADRRESPTPRFSRFTFRSGRREAFRRRGEGDSSFVDRYSQRLWAILLWIGLMNLADSFFTLIHLQDGGIELNPFAAMLLRTGRSGFVIAKAVLIGVALLVLCVHKNFGLARAGLLLAAGAYTLLVCYHLALFQLG